MITLLAQRIVKIASEPSVLMLRIEKKIYLTQLILNLFL